MITRQVARFSLRLLALQALALALVAVACQRVPLLAPTNSTITVTAAATTLPLNGMTDIIAQVLEPAGTPPQDGTLITFTTTLGSVQPPEAETSGGRVIVKFNAGTSSGTATITATSGGATGTSATGGTAGATTPSNAVRIAIGAAAVGRIVVGASPGTVSASGGSSTITANVADPNGNALAGVPVTFTTDVGSLSAAVVNTDRNGDAQTRLTTSRTSKVTATAGLTGSGSGTTATGATPATITVNVNIPPGISVGAVAPASPSVGQSVTFPLTYTSDANGSPIQSVTVDFGDGSPATTYQSKPASVSHTYTAIGSYAMRATAVDALGDTSSASGSVNVGALASVTVGTPLPSPPSVDQAVTFPLTYSATSGSPIQRLLVDFGDGTAPVSYAGTPSSVSHTYDSSGTFAMRVTAYDAFGNTSTGGVSVLVGAKPQPVVSISATTMSPTAGVDVAFAASVAPAAGSGTAIEDVTVAFGDGVMTSLGPVTGTSIALHHVYTVAETYTVVLTARDTNGGIGTATTTVFVQVAPPLAVTISHSGITTGLNRTETFTATVTGLGNTVVISYLWEFDNVAVPPITTNQITKDYVVNSGPHTVKVTITTSSNKSTFNTITIIE
jgi:hypothetical protein